VVACSETPNTIEYKHRRVSIPFYGPTVYPPYSSCPPKIPQGLTWAWTHTSAVRSRRLTAWAMARTVSWSKCITHISTLYQTTRCYNPEDSNLHIHTWPTLFLFWYFLQKLVTFNDPRVYTLPPTTPTTWNLPARIKISNPAQQDSQHERTKCNCDCFRQIKRHISNNAATKTNYNIKMACYIMLLWNEKHNWQFGMCLPSEKQYVTATITL
jgi:hypothetical protein